MMQARLTGKRRRPHGLSETPEAHAKPVCSENGELEDKGVPEAEL